MDLLLKCAKAFKQLMNYQYTFIIGRKGIAKELNICFSDTDFQHLVGLHKLKDLQLARKSRQLVLQEILSGTISIETVQKSSYSEECLTRLKTFQYIEEFLDSTQKIYKYDSKRVPYSLLEGEYLFVSEKNITLTISFLFLDHAAHTTYFCRSFFPMDRIDYSKGQAQYTLLKKIKRNIRTDIVEIIYEK